MLEFIEDISPNAVWLDKGFQKVSDFGKSNPYIVTVSTTAKYANVAPVNIFGANVNRFLPNQGNIQVDKEGKYTVLSQYGYSDYTENAFLANTMQAPFGLGVLRVETFGAASFIAQNNTVNFIYNDPTGKQKTKAVSIFRRLNQFIGNLAEFNLAKDNIVIDGDMQMQVVIPNANSSYTFYFYPSARASYKILKQTGHFGQKFFLPSIPLDANAPIKTKPIKVHMHDKKKPKAILV
jgi:hypothetical protein